MWLGLFIVRGYGTWVLWIFFFMLSWMFSIISWTPTVLSVLYACVSYFCICTCSAQLSMFHMKRHSRNTLIIIIIIIDLCFFPAPGPPCWPSGKVFASRAEDPGFESRLRRDFSGSSHTSDLKFGTPVATLPGAWRYRVSDGTGRPGVSIL